LVLIFCFLGSVIAEDVDEDDEHLQQMAATIMQNLQKDHMPNDDSTLGAHNAPLRHLHDIGKHAVSDDYFNKSDNIKVTVGVKGVRFVSVERNGKFVNFTTAFGVGAVALYKVKQEDDSDDNEINSMSEESNQEIDNSLKTLRNEYLDEKNVSNPNETNVLIAQKARYGLKLWVRKPERKEVKVRVDHGFVVWAKTNITKT